MAQPVPEGTPSVVPHLVVKDAPRAIAFYKTAFRATELFRADGPGGKGVMHAELQIGDGRIYIAEEFPGMGSLSPASLGGSSVTIHLWCEDVDTVFGRAVSAGAEVRMPVMDMFWGDRYGRLQDPFGHLWAIATHREDLTPAEMAKRAEASLAATVPGSETEKTRGRSKIKTAPKRLLRPRARTRKKR